MDNLVYDKSIVLIGPLCTGKTTTAEILFTYNEFKDFEYVSLDSEASKYYNEVGLDYEEEEKLYSIKDHKEWLKYRIPYNFQILKKVINDVQLPSIIDLGGWDTITSNKKDSEELKELLGRFKNVVLLIPSSDSKKSIKILEERWQKDQRGKYEIGSECDIINCYQLNDTMNDELATITVYTENKLPLEIADEILELIKTARKTY